LRTDRRDDARRRFSWYANASETQAHISTLLHRETERQREKVLYSVLLDGNVIVQFGEFFAEMKCKQHIIVKSRHLSRTRSCSELDYDYAKLGGMKAGG
jgi:hypothetical protein